jgi:hypothetical protein
MNKLKLQTDPKQVKTAKEARYEAAQKERYAFKTGGMAKQGKTKR